jgi:hypothetical protein
VIVIKYVSLILANFKELNGRYFATRSLLALGDIWKLRVVLSNYLYIPNDAAAEARIVFFCVV